MTSHVALASLHEDLAQWQIEQMHLIPQKKKFPIQAAQTDLLGLVSHAHGHATISDQL